MMDQIVEMTDEQHDRKNEEKTHNVQFNQLFMNVVDWRESSCIDAHTNTRRVRCTYVYLLLLCNYCARQTDTIGTATTTAARAVINSNGSGRQWQKNGTIIHKNRILYTTHRRLCWRMYCKQSNVGQTFRQSNRCPKEWENLIYVQCIFHIDTHTQTPRLAYMKLRNPPLIRNSSACR